MNENNNLLNDNIELSLPINPAYVSAARLTASSIANRMNFHIDEIEDIKAAVSEACTYIIRKSPIMEDSTFKIIFSLHEGVFNITIQVERSSDFEQEEEEMGLLMIKALMDTLDITTLNNGITELRMVKYHRENSF